MDFAPVVPIGLYLLAAFLVPVVSRVHKPARWPFAFLMSIISLLATASLYFTAQSGYTPYWLGNWAPVIGTMMGIGLVLDPLSWFFGMMIGLFGALCILYSKESQADAHATRYYALIFLACAGSLGVVFTGDLFNLFVFLELFNFVCVGLVAYDGTERALKASFNFLILASLATTFLLVGIIMLYSVTGTLNIAHIAYKLSELGATSFAGGGLEEALGALFTSGALVPLVAMALIFVGVGIKTSFFPLHTWMPEAYSAAPHGAGMLLIGMKYGTGLYALLRLFSVLFGFVGTSWLFIILGVITIFFGVMMAMMQTDFKRMLSYHAISQLGYMLLAAGLGTALGMTGCLFHVVNHVFYKGMLFLVAGAVIWRTGETDINKMGGLGRYIPLTMLCYAVGALSISGIPPFNGFASKWIIYNATFELHPILAALALLGSALTLASFLKVFHAVFLGKGTGGIVKEVPLSMTAPMLFLALLCLLFGLFPDFVIVNFVSPAARVLLNPGAYISSVLGSMIG
ncbi:MAG: proton-conducting transporter membrane subunit [Candidatus Micrarchaeota archaeon]